MKAQEGCTGKLSSRIEELSYLKTRLIIDTHQLRFYTYLAYPESYREEEAELRLGFSSPICIAGPLIHEGLRQELQSPLSYSPSSRVFYSRPRTRLDSGMDPSSREGLGFLMVPDAMSVFAYKSREVSFAGGIEGRLEAAESLIIDYLFSYCLPKHEESDSWFDRDWIYPGGDLLHLGGRISAEGHYYGLVLSGGLSAAARAGPGFFFHLLQVVNLSFLEFRQLFSYADMNYLNCKGDFADDLLQIAALLSINPEGRLNIDAMADWKLSRGKVSESVYLPSSLSLSTEAEFSLSPFRAGLVLEQDCEWNEDGGEEREELVELALGLEAAPFDFSITGGLLYYMEELETYSLSAETGLILGPLNADFSLSFIGEDEGRRSCGGSFEIGLKTKEGEGKLEIETLRDLPLESDKAFFSDKSIWDIITVSLSWTVTAPVN